MQATNIRAPVGLRWRKHQVANLQQDQAAIVDLLWRISISQGGMRGSELAPFLTGSNGHCPPGLADAIWNFQHFWKNQREFRNIDGVVDPGMNTLRKMNALANGQLVGPGEPNSILPPSSPNGPGGTAPALPKTPGSLRALGLYLTHWKIADGGGSLSIGAGPAGATTARIVLSKDGDPQPHCFTFAGASVGFGPLPFGVNFAPASLWGTGSRIAARFPYLQADDFRGPCTIIAGSSNFFVGIPDGATAGLILFGVKLSANLAAITRHIRAARAIGATLGHFKGADISLSAAVGRVS